MMESEFKKLSELGPTRNQFKLNSTFTSRYFFRMLLFVSYWHAWIFFKACLCNKKTIKLYLSRTAPVHRSADPSKQLLTYPDTIY